MRLLLVCLLVACADAPIDYGDVTDDPQLPPRGELDIEPWLAQQHFLTWRCETAVHDTAGNSAHRPRNRICSNSVLAAAIASGGELPIGSVSVKELYDASDVLMGYGVSRKVELGAGGTGWYWYEKHSNRLFADGAGDGSCPICHADAARDFTFVVVP